MTTPEFVFELHACRWAEIAWPPTGDAAGTSIIVGRQLGTRYRRWDTVIIECDPAGLTARRQFGDRRLDSDLLHVIRHAPAEWAWYRDVLPEPDYPWRYVREAVHRAADREILETRRDGNRIEIRRIAPYPDWFRRIIAIEHKPDLDASAADRLAAQLEFDVAVGLADEAWLATRDTDDAVPPALLEAMPVESGILSLDTEALTADVLWHPRRLAVSEPGTRILERGGGSEHDRSAARFEQVTDAEKADIRRRIAERAYERGWRSAVESMRPDCRHFTLATDTLTHEPRCRAKGRAQSAFECTGNCPDFEPEPPAWRMHGWPLSGGPGQALSRLLSRQRSRYR